MKASKRVTESSAYSVYLVVDSSTAAACHYSPVIEITDYETGVPVSGSDRVERGRRYRVAVTVLNEGRQRATNVEIAFYTPRTIFAPRYRQLGPTVHVTIPGLSEVTHTSAEPWIPWWPSWFPLPLRWWPNKVLVNCNHHLDPLPQENKFRACGDRHVACRAT